MEKVVDEQLLEQYIQAHEMILVYFTGSTCSACEVIKSKVASILKKYTKVIGIEVNAIEYPALGAKYQVFSVPVFILYVQGKETVREGRNVDLLAFEKKIERYNGLLFGSN